MTACHETCINICAEDMYNKKSPFTSHGNSFFNNLYMIFFKRVGMLI